MFFVKYTHDTIPHVHIPLQTASYPRVSFCIASSIAESMKKVKRDPVWKAEHGIYRPW